MFFPIRTDRRLQHTPWVNYALIAANVMVFVLTHHVYAESAWRPYMLTPAMPRLWQFLTYQFLHQDLMHLAGNMLFLYVFGNSVEDRLGKLGYPLFYLAGGVVAGFGHALLQNNPVLGASGAVCAVTGAYLALFPLSNITIMYWFIFIGAFEVSGFLLILFQIAQDLVMFLWRSGGVAYLAHISGYTFGFVVGMGLLLTRLLPREPYDLLTVLEHRRRRRRFSSLTQRGYQPWASARPGETPLSAHAPAGDDPRQRELMEQRAGIAQLAEHDLPAAAAAYEKLLEADAGQVLSLQLQLDLANQLMSAGRYQSAARAYELFLHTHTGYSQREQIELILALIYTRYLDRGQRARELLTSALTRLRDPTQVELARQTLAHLG